MSDPISAAKAELARRQGIAAAKAELARRQSAQPADPRAAMLASPTPPKPDTAQIQSQIDRAKGVDETVASLLNKGGESLTLGVVGDEAAAGFDKVIGRGEYDDRLKFYRDQQKTVEAEHPVLSLVADVAPALLPGVGAAGAVAKLGNIAGRTAAGALTGAAAGGLYGFMEGEGDDRLRNAGTTALTGAVLGAAAPKVTDFAASIPGRVRNVFVASTKRPTVEALRAAKNVAYQAVDDAGEVFDGDTMGQLARHVRGVFDADNYVEETDNALKATLNLLDKRAGQPTTLTQLDSIRKNLWGRYASAKDQPQILDAIAAIDHVINTRGAASELMGVARAANSRFAKSELLENAFTKATDQTAATGSGGNILNKYRQAVTSIINDDRKAKFFSKGEIEMMRTFVRGSKSENMKRLVGKLSPSGNGLMMALHVIGGVASQGASLPLMAAGALAKNSADASAMRGAGAIQDFVAGVPKLISGGSSGAALAVGAAPVAERLQSGVRNMLNPLQSVPR